MAQCMVANHKEDANPVDTTCLTAIPPGGKPLNQKSFMATLEAAIQSKNSPSLVPIVKLEMPAAEVEWRPGVSSTDGMAMNSGSTTSGCNSAGECDVDKESLAAYKHLCSTHQEARGVVDGGDGSGGGGKLTHPCHVCAGRYPTWSHLRRHLQTHTAYRPHACHSCAKRFRNYSKLKRHLLTHSGAKPYRCPVCDRTVSRAEHLKRHLLVHSEQRPYKCGACDYSARRLDSLRTHQRNKHGEQETRVLYMGGNEQLLDASALYTPTAATAAPGQKRKRKKKSKACVEKESSNGYEGVSAETRVLLQHASQITGYDASSLTSGVASAAAAVSEAKHSDQSELEQVHGKTKYCLNSTGLYHQEQASQCLQQKQHPHDPQQQQQQQQPSHQQHHQQQQQQPQQHHQQQQHSQQQQQHLQQIEQRQQQLQQQNHQHMQQQQQQPQQQQAQQNQQQQKPPQVSNPLIPKSRCSTPEATMSMMKLPVATAAIRSASVDDSSSTMDARIMAQQLMAPQCANEQKPKCVDATQKLFQSRDPMPIPYSGVPVSGYIQEAKLKPRLWEPAPQQAGQAYGASYAPFPPYFGQQVVPPDPYLANRYFMPEHSIAAAAAAAFDVHNPGFYMPRPAVPPPSTSGGTAARAGSPAHSVPSPIPDFFRKRIRQECEQLNRMTQSPTNTDADNNY